ncbi:MAG TPA: DMT family transporter [Casimicrobiaceae bacterium]|nr:DMT family transporter [Casimicrobiaceae bacterium]
MTTPAHSAAKAALAAYLLLALAVLCWAGNFVVGRWLRLSAPPVALTFWRWTVAFVVLAPFTFSHIRHQWPAIRRSWKILCLLALFATVLQHIPIYWGLRDTTATNAALLNATSPIFIALASVLLLGTRLGAAAIFGTLLSFAGVLVIVSRGSLAVLRSFELNPGDAWILFSALSWAGYTVCLRWRPAELRGLDLLTVIAAISVVMLAPLWAIEASAGRVLVPSAESIAGIAYVGIVASVLAYISWNHGVAQIGPARAGPFMYMMLVYTPILSILFLGERIEAFHLAGAALIIAGIYLATVRANRTEAGG